MGHPAFDVAPQFRAESAALLAAGHDSGVEAVAQAGGQVVDFVRAVDFDGLAGGVEDDLAVATSAQMRLQFGACIGGYRVVDEVIEKAEEFFAGHFSLPVFSGFGSLSPFFLWK